VTPQALALHKLADDAPGLVSGHASSILTDFNVSPCLTLSTTS
jgi:hypothetical protein